MLIQITGMESRSAEMEYIYQNSEFFSKCDMVMEVQLGLISFRKRVCCQKATGPFSIVGFEIDIVIPAYTCLDRILTLEKSLNYQRIFD
jgi:hypothetical protein